MPARPAEPHRARRDGTAPLGAMDELVRALFAQGGLVWLSGRSLLFLVLLLGWLVVR